MGCDLSKLPVPPGKLQKWDDVPAPSEDLKRADDVIRRRRDGAGGGPAGPTAQGTVGGSVTRSHQPGFSIPSSPRSRGRAGLTNAVRFTVTAVIMAACCARPVNADAQSNGPPRLRAAPLSGHLAIDGLLDEPAWASAEPADTFPPGGSRRRCAATARTVVRVARESQGDRHRHRLRRSRACGIVSFSVRRDAPLDVRGSRPRRPRSVSRRPIGIRLRRQSERRALRRPDQPGRRERQPGLGRHLGGRNGRGRRRAGAPRSAIPMQTLELQARSARMALQRPAAHSAAARNRSLGVPRAPIPDHADQPRRPADRSAGVRSWARPDRASRGHDRRRHSGAGRRRSTASFSRAST